MADAKPFWEDPDNVERFANRPPDERLLELLPSYPEPEKTRVLDLGCAGGRNTEVLAERGFDFHALDSSSAMVEHTRKRVSAVLGKEEAERRVMRGSMDDLLVFESEWFELVVALGIYHSAECRAEWDRALDETARVLVAGGLLLTANFSPESDPKGESLRPVVGEPNVYEGFDPGPTFLLDAPEVDVQFSHRDLHPVTPTYTVKTATETGHRVTVNGLFRKGLLPLAVFVTVLSAACADTRDQAESLPFAEPDTLFATRIPIDADLQLRDGFDYSVYAGVIRSADSLRRLWSHVVNVQHEFYGRRDAVVPDPPEVDFRRSMILWFGHRGVGASFVDSLKLTASSGPDSLYAKVHVFHSDFGSSGLDMWQIPRTRRAVVFEVRHEYEKQAP